MDNFTFNFADVHYDVKHGEFKRIQQFKNFTFVTTSTKISNNINLWFKLQAIGKESKSIRNFELKLLNDFNHL